MTTKPSRNVTRARCVVCDKKYKATRRDARYCSGTCRQRATRARAQCSDIDREIEEARKQYWDAVRRKAEANGLHLSQVLTAEAQFVDEDGNVYMGGDTIGGVGGSRRLVGRTEPIRSGWAAWGLEAAGAPFSPPIEGLRRKKARTGRVDLDNGTERRNKCV